MDTDDELFAARDFNALALRIDEHARLLESYFARHWPLTNAVEVAHDALYKVWRWENPKGNFIPALIRAAWMVLKSQHCEVKHWPIIEDIEEAGNSECEPKHVDLAHELRHEPDWFVRMATMRAAGQTWDEIGKLCGERGNTCCVRFQNHCNKLR